jgi:hypothetical protein
VINGVRHHSWTIVLSESTILTTLKVIGNVLNFGELCRILREGVEYISCFIFAFLVLSFGETVFHMTPIFLLAPARNLPTNFKE